MDRKLSPQINMYLQNDTLYQKYDLSLNILPLSHDRMFDSVR